MESEGLLLGPLYKSFTNSQISAIVFDISHEVPIIRDISPQIKFYPGILFHTEIYLRIGKSKYFEGLVVFYLLQLLPGVNILNTVSFLSGSTRCLSCFPFVPVDGSSDGHQYDRSSPIACLGDYGVRTGPVPLHQLVGHMR